MTVLNELNKHKFIVERLQQRLMRDGLKGKAVKLFNSLIGILKAETGLHPYFVIYKAVDNIRPLFSFKRLRRGPNFCDVPCVVSLRTSETIALNWLFNNSGLRLERGFINRLSYEILDAFGKKGHSVRSLFLNNQLVLQNRFYVQLFSKNRRRRVSSIEDRKDWVGFSSYHTKYSNYKKVSYDAGEVDKDFSFKKDFKGSKYNKYIKDFRYKRLKKDLKRIKDNKDFKYQKGSRILKYKKGTS